MNAHFVRRTGCPGCGAPAARELLRASYTAPPISDYLVSFYSAQGGVDLELLEGGEYALSECGGCGLLYQTEIPGPELSLKLYEEWIDPQKAFELYEAPRDLGYFLTLTGEIANLVAHLGAAPSGVDVLDFGMGWGWWCRAALGLGCRAYGVELSPTKAEHAAACGVRVLRWDEVPERRFDVVNADQVFEHIPEPLETLRSLGRALKPGGLLKVAVPDGRGVKRNLGRGDWLAPAGSPRSLNPVAPLEHVNCFDRRALLAMARRAGLEPVFVPTRYVVATSPGAASPQLAKKLVKSLLGDAARLVVRAGTSVVLRNSR